METSEFEIVSSVAANGSSTLITLIGIITFGCILFICVALSIKLSRKDEASPKAIHIFLSALLGIGAAWGVKKIDQQRNPQNYTKYVTCMYIFKSDKESVLHTTFVLRINAETECSRVGTKVIRVKNNEWVQFYLPFELPSKP